MKRKLKNFYNNYSLHTLVILFTIVFTFLFKDFIDFEELRVSKIESRKIELENTYNGEIIIYNGEQIVYPFKNKIKIYHTVHLIKGKLYNAFIVALGLVTIILFYIFSIIAIYDLYNLYWKYKQEKRKEKNTINNEFINEFEELINELGFDISIKQDTEINPNKIILELKNYLRRKMKK